MLLFFALLASGYGLLLIYSATQYLDNDRFIRFMLVQTAAIFLGVVAYMLLTLVDFRLFTEKTGGCCWPSMSCLSSCSSLPSGQTMEWEM